MPSLNQKGLFSPSDSFWTIMIFLTGASATLADQYFFHLPLGSDMLSLFLGVAIATIFVPGAGVSSAERWQKWFLTHATMALLGCVAGDAIVGVYSKSVPPLSAAVGVVVLVGVFVSYWSQGYQSRFHMMEVFEKTLWQEQFQHVSLLLGVLESSRIRRPDISHRIRQAVMNCEHETVLNPDDWRRLEGLVLEGTVDKQRVRLERLLQKARRELEANAEELEREPIEEDDACVTSLTARRERERS